MAPAQVANKNNTWCCQEMSAQLVGVVDPDR
jgi:hypothetical protein